MERTEPNAELPAAPSPPVSDPPTSEGPVDPPANPEPPMAILIEEPLSPPPLSETPTEPTPLVDKGPWKLVWATPTPSRRLAETLIVFVAAILFLRAMAIEPFGVPTGSMAPTLIGNHKCVSCPRCGFPIRVGDVSDDQRGPKHKQEEAAAPQPVTCPNCGQANVDLRHGILISGDRLLVDKNVFRLRSPRRWEPAVFRRRYLPEDKETDIERLKPYVKRVIGLPGENVFIADGDIFINGKLARKTLTQARETRVLVFDMNYPPQPDGWVNRWSIESNLPPAVDGANEAVFLLADKELRLDGRKAGSVPLWIGYSHHLLNSATGLEEKASIRDDFVYNELPSDSKDVHDFLIEFEIEIIEGSGTLQCRMQDGKDFMIASCPIGAPGEAQLRCEGLGMVRTSERKPLKAGKKYRIVMAFVDRRASFAIDGSEPFESFDLMPATEREKVSSPCAIAVQGAQVVIRDFRIYRDIYYRDSGTHAGLRNGPLLLGPDEYFMMGDNSANSHDSRSWPIPGVPEKNFLGKPFLLHQPSRIAHLTIGGAERVFQSIDWSRIRILR